MEGIQNGFYNVESIKRDLNVLHRLLWHCTKNEISHEGFLQ